MTEIPEDVRRAAIAALDAYRHQGGSSLLVGFESQVEALSIAILAAQEAQRERDAKIADDYVFDKHALAQATEYGLGAHETASEIAAAIRKG